MPEENPIPFVNHPKSVSVAVLSLFSHALYSDKTKAMGGAERRAYYWLRLLQESGFSVSAVLAHQEAVAKDFKSRLSAPWPLYEHPKYRADGHIVRAKGAGSGLMPRLRDKFLSLLNRPLPNATEQNALLGTAVYRQIDADAYVAFGLTNAANELARFCADQGKRFIVSIAHDVDFDFLEQPVGKDSYDSKRELKAETLHLADVVVSQTKSQGVLLYQHGIDKNKIHLIKNPIEVLSLPESKAPSYFLWVGRLDKNKNSPAFLSIASRCPNFKFVMVISETTTSDFELQIKKKLSNLTIINSAAPSEMRRIYQKAFCLVSTSFNEGFPNTFLEAWESAVPVASLHVNPDGLLTSNQLGFFSNGSLEDLEFFLREIEINPNKRIEMGRQCRKFVERHHELKMVSNKVTALFKTSFNE